MLFLLAFIFLSLISHICLSLFESGFPKRLLPFADDRSTIGAIARPVKSARAGGTNKGASGDVYDYATLRTNGRSSNPQAMVTAMISHTSL